MMTCIAAAMMFAASVCGACDANLADFPRLAGETDDSPRFVRAISAAPNGVLCVPKGEYDIGSMILITNRCSLSMHPAAHLVARAKMKYVIFWDGAADYHALSVFNPDGSVYDNANLFIRGGDIDGNGLASCLAIANSHHFTLADVTLHNGVRSGLCVTRETGGHLYELVANNVYCKCTMSGLAGNIGIDCQTADCHFTDCIVVDYTKGIRSSGGSNRFTRCHVWGGTVPPKGMGFKEWSDAYARRKQLEAAGKWTAEEERSHLTLGVPEMLPNSVAFECIGDSNVFDGCYADTAEIGYDIHRGATIVNSGFYNNPRMNLRKSTAIVHRGRHLRVAFCDFRGAAGCEKLYEGKGENVDWVGNTASGGAGMAVLAVCAAFGANASFDADYLRPVRPIGVDGQPAWNGRSIFFMYPPTFGFERRDGAASYRFTVKDEAGVERSFVGRSPNDSLAPIWGELPLSGWMDLSCEALDANGVVITNVGERSFWKQAPFVPGSYPAAKRSPDEASKLIARYVMNLPIVQANYLSGKPIPKEMVNPGNQVFIAYPSKMGAAIVTAMAKLAAGDTDEAKAARRLAEGAVRKLMAVTEPEGCPLAGFPRTYEAHPGLSNHPAKMIRENIGKIMLVYPRAVANAYLDLYEVTKAPELKAAAVRIADLYLKLQGDDGTWPLNVWLKDGQPVEKNRLVPVHMLGFFERMYAVTGDAKYRAAADRAFAYIEKDPLTTWNWEGQFEDVTPSEPYRNLTKHDACDTAMYLVRRFPSDPRRLAQARELVRFAEDQFVCWERPMHGKKDPRCKMGTWGCESWRCPAVLEQYNCYVPIDASAAKLIRTWLAMYRATKNPLDLARARALGDAIIRETHDDGYLPTFWMNTREDWPNCMLASATALAELAEIGGECPPD